MEHLFRDCEISKRFWACNELGIRVTHDSTIDIRKWIIHWVNYMGKLEEANVLLLRFMATLWCLWGARNKILFKKEKFHPTTLLSTWVLEVGMAEEALVEYSKEREKRIRNMADMEDERRRWLRESKPFYAVGSGYNCECIRVMVDAGWKTWEKASIGWVAYTETGQKIVEKCMTIKAESSLQAEAMGLRAAVLWAREARRWHVEISSDCLPLVAFFAGMEKAHHLTKEILEEILAISSSFHCLSFSYIPRSTNEVAHSLACKAMPR
ncbi:uncharacterized protein LOC141608564 [Silene latifolia]|uniref:uncharacterized protein LOC141608564 n=1 Tax=Silene latifolia TaxID=37657 RepID=UPI003D76C914